MSFAHTVTLGYTIPGHTVPSNKTVYTADTEINFEVAAAHSATKQINCEIDVSQIQSMVLYSDKDVTLHAGDGSSVGDGASISLSAGKNLIWTVDSDFACPFTIDVEKIYVVNAGSTSADDATVKIFVLTNAAA